MATRTVDTQLEPINRNVHSGPKNPRVTLCDTGIRDERKKSERRKKINEKTNTGFFFSREKDQRTASCRRPIYHYLVFVGRPYAGAGYHGGEKRSIGK